MHWSMGLDLFVMYLIRSSWTNNKVNELGQYPPVTKAAFGSSALAFMQAVRYSLDPRSW